MQTSGSSSSIEELEPRPRVSLRWLLSTWLPPLIGVLVICGESTEAMSGQHTSIILRPLYNWLFGPISDATWDDLHHYIRKSGHFCGYGTIALLFVRAWYRSLWLRAAAVRRGAYQLARLRGQIRMQSAALALLCTAMVASGDEFHQTFVPGRTGLVSDVGIDTTGGAVFLLLCWMIVKLRGTTAVVE
jgi:VanZ family protein